MEVNNNDVNILINDSINIVNHSNVRNSDKFNPEVIDSLSSGRVNKRHERLGESSSHEFE